jgi:hypothetical protein
VGASRGAAASRLRFVVVVATLVVALAMGLGFALRPSGPDVRQLTRAHLHEAARIRPLTFREAVVDDAVEWEIAEADAEKLAAALAALMRERFALWIAHHDQPLDVQRTSLVAAVARDQDLLRRVRATLAPWGDDEFRDRIFRVWQMDSAVPYRFLPALTHDELQRRVFPNGIVYMKETRDQRWSQTARLSRRVGVDERRTRQLLEPLVVERERLLEQYGTAPLDELPGLEARMKELRSRGRQALQGVVADDVADALVAGAFIGIPDTERGEAQIDEKAIVVFGS